MPKLCTRIVALLLVPCVAWGNFEFKSENIQAVMSRDPIAEQALMSESVIFPLHELLTSSAGRIRRLVGISLVTTAMIWAKPSAEVSRTPGIGGWTGMFLHLGPGRYQIDWLWHPISIFFVIPSVVLLFGAYQFYIRAMHHHVPQVDKYEFLLTAGGLALAAIVATVSVALFLESDIGLPASESLGIAVASVFGLVRVIILFWPQAPPMIRPAWLRWLTAASILTLLSQWWFGVFNHGLKWFHVSVPNLSSPMHSGFDFAWPHHLPAPIQAALAVSLGILWGIPAIFRIGKSDRKALWTGGPRRPVLEAAPTALDVQELKNEAARNPRFDILHAPLPQLNSAADEVVQTITKGHSVLWIYALYQTYRAQPVVSHVGGHDDLVDRATLMNALQQRMAALVGTSNLSPDLEPRFIELYQSVTQFQTILSKAIDGFGDPLITLWTLDNELRIYVRIFGNHGDVLEHELQFLSQSVPNPWNIKSTIVEGKSKTILKEEEGYLLIFSRSVDLPFRLDQTTAARTFPWGAAWFRSPLFWVGLLSAGMSTLHFLHQDLIVLAVWAGIWMIYQLHNLFRQPAFKQMPVWIFPGSDLQLKDLWHLPARSHQNLVYPSWSQMSSLDRDKLLSKPWLQALMMTMGVVAAAFFAAQWAANGHLMNSGELNIFYTFVLPGSLLAIGGFAALFSRAGWLFGIDARDVGLLPTKEAQRLKRWAIRAQVGITIAFMTSALIFMSLFFYVIGQVLSAPPLQRPIAAMSIFHAHGVLPPQGLLGSA